MNYEHYFNQWDGHATCTSRTRDHAFPPLFRAQMSHLVVSPPNLEAENRLEVLSLQKYPSIQPLT